MSRVIHTLSQRSRNRLVSWEVDPPRETNPASPADGRVLVAVAIYLLPFVVCSCVVFDMVWVGIA